MRKAKDERIKITTHNFRISIEEEDEDAEAKKDDEQTTELPADVPAEVPAALAARRISISIEAEPGTSLVADLDDLNRPVAVEQLISDQPAQSPLKIREIDPVLDDEGPGGSSLSREDEQRRVERPEVFEALTGLEGPGALTGRRISITIEAEPGTSLIAAPGELDQPVIVQQLVSDPEQAHSPLKILEIETLLGDGGPGGSIVPERDEKSKIAGAEGFEIFTGLHSGFTGLEGHGKLEDPGIGRLEGPRELEDPGIRRLEGHRELEDSGIGRLEGHRKLEDPGIGRLEGHRKLEDPGIGRLEGHRKLEDSEIGRLEGHRKLEDSGIRRLEGPRELEDSGIGRLEGPRELQDPGIARLEGHRKLEDPGIGRLEGHRKLEDSGIGRLEGPRELEDPGIGRLEGHRKLEDSGIRRLEGPRELEDPGIGRLEGPRKSEDLGLSTRSRVLEAPRTCELEVSRRFEDPEGLGYPRTRGLESPRGLDDPRIREFERFKAENASEEHAEKETPRFEDPEGLGYRGTRGLESPRGLDDPRIREFERLKAANESEEHAEKEKPRFEAERRRSLADLAVPDADRASNAGIGDLAASMTISDRNLAGFHAGSHDLSSSRKSSLDATLYRNSQRSHGPSTASDNPAGLSNYAAMRGEAPGSSLIDANESREGQAAIKVGTEQVAGSEEYVGGAPIKDEAKLKFWIESGEQKGARDPWELRFPQTRTFEQVASIEDRKSLIKRRAGFRSSNQPGTRVPKYSAERSSESSDSEDGYQASKKGAGRLSVIDQLMSKSWNPTERKDSWKRSASTKPSRRKSSRSSESGDGWQTGKKGARRLSVIDQLISKSWTPVEPKDARRSTASPTIVKRKSSWTSGSSDSSDEDYYQARKKGARRLSVIDKLILKSWNPMERRDSQKSSASAKSSKHSPGSPRSPEFSERLETSRSIWNPLKRRESQKSVSSSGSFKGKVPDSPGFSEHPARSLSLEGQPRSRFWNPLKRRESQKSSPSPGSFKRKVPDSPGFSEYLDTARIVSPEGQPRWKSWNPVELKDSRRSTTLASPVKRKSTWTSGSSDSSDDEYYQARMKGARRLSVIDKLILKSWNPRERKDSQRSSASAKSSKDSPRSPRSPEFSERLDTTRSIWNPLKRRESQKSVSSSGSFKGKVPDSPGFSEPARSVSPEGQPRSKSWNPFKRRESQKSVSSSGSSKLPDSPGPLGRLPSSEEVARIVPCTLTNVNEVEKRVYKPRSSVSSTSSGQVSPAVAITMQLGGAKKKDIATPASPLFIQTSLKAENGGGSSLDESILKKPALEGANIVEVDDELLSKRRLTMPMVGFDEKSATGQANLLSKSEAAGGSSLDESILKKPAPEGANIVEVDDELLSKRRLTMPMVGLDEKSATVQANPLLSKIEAAARSSLDGGSSFKKWDSSDTEDDTDDDRLLLKRRLTMPMVLFDEKRATSRVDPLLFRRYLKAKAAVRSSLEDFALKRQESGDAKTVEGDDQVLLQRRLTMPTGQADSLPIGKRPEAAVRSSADDSSSKRQDSEGRNAVGETTEALSQRRLTVPTVEFAATPIRASPLLVRRSLKAEAAAQASLQVSSSQKLDSLDGKTTEEGNQVLSMRRLTMPMVGFNQDSPKTPTHDPLSGTSVNPIRRSSIANAAICSSLLPSLVGAWPGIPDYLLPSGEEGSAGPVPNTSDSFGKSSSSGLKLKFPFLRLHIPEQQHSSTWQDPEDPGQHPHQHHHHHHHVFSHFHVPTITFTAQTDGESGRKFNFGIRRHSQTTLHRTDSMVSLCYRSLASYITDDNLAGLQNFLENKRVQVDDRDENGSTALILAAAKGKIHFVRELVNHGADVNAEDGDNWTALLCAAKEGHADVCLELLEHGADLEHRDMGGWTALMWATYKGRSPTVTMLLARGADVNAHGNFHISSLLWAAGRGYPDIVKDLIAHGAKVNVGDKYGTTALVWGSRKGNVEIVDTLLKGGANVDTAGMYSWTALLVATLGNHVDVVLLLLEHKPNVNALDKDGCTALAIACREGHHEIANALLNSGAYVNIQDRAGDTNLIHAVKGGHRGVVESLLKKYADVDIAGKDKKTATYIAVEKGNIPILKLLLNANPDLEIATKDGDTPLLRAVRSRNAEIVQLLLDKKAKVSATDKKGDTVLHIAMRARSKAIVEILLRNPKNSQLLYRPNRQGETPYNIDINHPKTILGQIFGARRLNTNEDNENMLGYDLYSSALADILSEPSLSTPITVGLYAKWGSGKSFLLNKLKEEMKNFARQWIDPVFQFSFLLFVVVTHASLLVGITIGLALQSWITGLACGISLIVITYAFLILIWYANKRYDWYWPYNFTVALTTKLNSLKLLLQVIFCHPPGGQVHDGVTAQPIKFYFTDQTRVGTTAAGENAVVQMVGSLYDSIENDFGSLSTRLYRAFRPKPDKSTTTWKWRHLCCLPYIVIFEFCFCSLLVGISVLTVYLIDLSTDEETIEKVTAHIIMITVALILGVSIIANLYTWNRTLQALVFSQRRHLQRSISKLETLKSEGFIQTLRSEVSLMTEMVKCLDSFMAQQSRLVIIVDGLDSCEQDKVLLVLDAIQALFSDNGYPFVVILAIDPHIIAKAVEVNSRRLFTESNIGGHDYLRNMVHLPFYLQNSGLRKVKIAQQTAQHGRKTTWTEAEESVTYTATSTMHHSMSNRRLSTESGIMNSNEKLKPQSRKGSRKLRLSESIASSIGSNLNRLGGAQDLNKMLLTDDYFSDVNPRSMRRLMNVVYVTGRLLKAFQIDFNWYHLASWINITEQWPFRTSWLILHYDMYEDNLDDTMSLKSLYDKIRPQIPVLKEVQPLLEMDRDERKLDIFLTFHRSSLLVSDMKIFLPFTINLDPYIKKKIKEEQQSIEEDAGLGPYKQYSPWTMHGSNQESWNASRTGTTNRAMKLARTPSLQGPGQVPPTPAAWCMQPSYDWQPPPPWVQMPPMEPAIKPLSAITTLPSEILEIRLSSLTVGGICDLIDRIESLNPNQAPQYKNVIKENNINGRVLLHCDLQELKKVLKMAFGDWELFRMVVVSLREVELSSFSTHEEGPRSVRFTVGLEQIQRKDHNLQNTSIRVPTIVEKEKGTTRTDGPSRRDQTKQSIMEKQVTLEEQMICGALQTLNEEACEDVLDVPSPAVVPSDSLPGSTSAASQDTDYVILQSNPLLHWVPVNDEPETSDDSSLESTVQLQRTNSQRSIASQHSTRSTCSFGRRDPRKDGGNGTSSRPSSLFVSPPPSPRPAFRSRSTDENYVANNIPLKPTISTPIKKLRSTSTLNEEIVLPVPVLNSSLEKLSKLKDRLMGTLPASPAPGESEDESTPLVSELSTPTHSQSDSVFKHDYSEENSSSVSSNKSLPRDGERSIDVDYSDTVSLMVRESPHVRFVSRQDAEEWDNPETPV